MLRLPKSRGCHSNNRGRKSGDNQLENTSPAWENSSRPYSIWRI